jgi:hypothetical protein
LKAQKKKLKRKRDKTMRVMTMEMKMLVTITMVVMTTMERMITMDKTMMMRKRRATMIRKNLSKKRPNREKMIQRKEKKSTRLMTRRIRRNQVRKLPKRRL